MTAPTPHARDSHDLQGMEAPASTFIEALERNRLHHAWLLCGPQGVGKASFAYQAARRLLGARADPAGGLLASAPGDAVSRMILARSHPDLLVLERDDGEGGAPRKSIPVDEARRLPEFFSKSPALGPCRVAIVDAADDLNVNAANAVLKTLEEPSGQGVLFLVSHAPGRLLATIRSRCRRLAFPPWPRERLVAFIVDRIGAEEADAQRLAEMAHGAPGRAVALHAQGALELDHRLGEILSRLPETDPVELMHLADGFRGGEGAQRFSLLMERLGDRISDAATTLTRDGRTGEPFASAWERVSATPARVEAVNLDRADAFWSVMADLQSVARTHGFPRTPAC